MNRKYIETFVEGNFDTLFEISVRDKERCFLQNGGISQNCPNAWKTWVGNFKAGMFSIPPWSPDSNPIENIFSLFTDWIGRKSIRRWFDKEEFWGICYLSKKDNVGIGYWCC